MCREVLVRAGCDVSAKTKKLKNAPPPGRFTALEMASHRGHTALVSTLTTLVEALEKSASEAEQVGGTHPERAGCTDEAEVFLSAEEAQDEPAAS